MMCIIEGVIQKCSDIEIGVLQRRSSTRIVKSITEIFVKNLIYRKIISLQPETLPKKSPWHVVFKVFIVNIRINRAGEMNFKAEWPWNTGKADKVGRQEKF